MTGQARDVFEERRLRSLGRQTSSFFDNTVDQDFNQSTNLQSYYARLSYNYNEKYFLTQPVNTKKAHLNKSNELFFINVLS